jgi:hypothetical protein
MLRIQRRALVAPRGRQLILSRHTDNRWRRAARRHPGYHVLGPACSKACGFSTSQDAMTRSARVNQGLGQGSDRALPVELLQTWSACVDQSFRS